MNPKDVPHPSRSTQVYGVLASHLSQLSGHSIMLVRSVSPSVQGVPCRFLPYAAGNWLPGGIVIGTQVGGGGMGGWGYCIVIVSHHPETVGPVGPCAYCLLEQP